MRWTRRAGIAVGLLAGVLAGAQDRPPDKPGEKDRPKNESKIDREFVETAAQDSMLEVRLGELASKQASNPDVKKFGQMMVADHTRANTELLEVARKHNVTIAKELAPRHQQQVERLGKLTGAEFDREYVNLMVSEHTKDVESFQKQARENGQPEDLKAWVQRTLPKLEEHLRHARELREKLGNKG